MQISKAKYALLLGVLVVTFSVQAQYSTDNRIIEEHMRYSNDKAFNTWSVSLGYGPLIMYNDLASYTIFPTHWKFGPNIMVSKQLFPAWAFDLQFLSGNYRAGNSTYYSEGDLLDFSINSRTYINQLLAMPGPINDHWNFYFKLGLGMTAFRTRVHYSHNDEVVHFGDFGEENEDDGYIVLGWDKHDPYKKIDRAKELIIPIGFGVQYRLNRSFDIGLESTMRLSLEDKLDNILVGSENDKYWSTSISISYKIGKKNKRHSKWTYRGYGFNVFGAPKKDPLKNEVRLLEQQLLEYAEGRTVKTDSITIINHTQKIYGSASIVSVFFEHKKANNLDTESKIEMATLALNMLQNPEWKAVIYGYADDVDQADENYSISELRCQRILDFYVKSLGLDSSRFELKPKGEEDLLSDDLLSSGARRSVNQRVDVVVIK
ncbi:OmpA family protein [Carboxylicivirga sp. N1Y90]|uniref:OmpA family protein n=1 Tax=Carboxylicivirga fragile TaxID=3417571 RepID=UPI003D336F75|nr:OmpA family protein [Marinilabiliaceae bacterium N1Y90]